MIERDRRHADDLAEGEASVLDPLWQAVPELHVSVPADPDEHAATGVSVDSSRPRTVSGGYGAPALAAPQNEERAELLRPFHFERETRFELATLSF